MCQHLSGHADSEFSSEEVDTQGGVDAWVPARFYLLCLLSSLKELEAMIYGRQVSSVDAVTGCHIGTQKSSMILVLSAATHPRQL